jgi:chemotaxis protein methyltransferase CheR
MNTELDDVVRLISQTLGKDVSLYDRSFLTKSLEKRLQKASIETSVPYLRYLSENREEAEAFFRSLNIAYSEFFRGQLVFALLEQVILPGLIEEKEKSAHPEIRIWSAGCAAGQEAYSIAMLLDELAMNRGTDIPYRIFATDASEAELVSARKGVYDSSTVLNVRLRHIDSYFTRQGEAYVVAARLQDRIDFSLYDLLDDRSSCPPVSIFGDFDLILCCNLLFYYRQDMRQFILHKVCRCLAHKGYLVTGEAERGIVEQTQGFHAVAVPAAVFQRTDRIR